MRNLLILNFLIVSLLSPLLAKNVVEIQIETEYQQQLDVPVIHPAVAIASFLGECPGFTFETMGFKATAQGGENVRDPGVNITFSMPPALT